MEIHRTLGVATHAIIPLIDSSNRPDYKTSSTLTAGDVKVLRHTGGVWNEANINSLPAEIGSSGVLDVTLTATEMTPDDTGYPVVVKFVDAAGAEWDDNMLIVWLGAVQADVIEINQGATDGYNAVLKLKGLDISHNTDHAVKITTSANDKHGIQVTTNGLTAHGIRIDTTDGSGVYVVANGSNQNALFLNSRDSYGVQITADSLAACRIAGVAFGIDVDASGGTGLRVVGTANDILADLAGSVQTITTAGLAEFASVDTGETTAVAGSVAKLSQSADVTFTPISVTVDTGIVSDTHTSVFQHSGPTQTFVINDSDGAAIDVSAESFTFKVSEHDEQSADTIFTRSSTDGQITVGGTDSNQVSVVYSSTGTTRAGGFRYQLRNTATEALVRARGSFNIVEMQSTT